MTMRAPGVVAGAESVFAVWSMEALAKNVTTLRVASLGRCPLFAARGLVFGWKNVVIHTRYLVHSNQNPRWIRKPDTPTNFTLHI